jgi:F0F1-type ATP synthase membrane subunit b/b'
MKAIVIRQTLRPTTACELRRNLAGRLAIAGAAVLLVATINVGAQSAAPEQPAAAHQEPAHGGAPAQDQHEAAGDHAAEGEHGGLSGLLWPTANFLVLCGALYYFLGTPFTTYLSGRSSQIRKDLLDAAELNRTASAQLADVDRKMKALPAELDALRTRGALEIAAEEERIAGAAAADRARLLTQTRREIEVRLQAAQRELSDHAAELALNLASQRLSREMTPADHTRLVDRYVAQVKER